MKMFTKLSVCMIGFLMVVGKAVGTPPEVHRPAERCDKWEKVLSNQGTDRRVILVKEGCGGFSNGLKDSIAIRVLPGRRVRLRSSYEPQLQTPP